MSPYNAAPCSDAENPGRDAADPELAPFLPTMDESEGSNTPSGAGAGRSVVALPPNAGFVSLHAKAESTGCNVVSPTPSCAACHAPFPKNYQLEQHATKNKHKAYLCTCSKGFTKLSALRRHIQESTKVREHRCPLCNHECKRPGHVEQHLRLVHKKSKDVIKNLLNTQKSEPRQEPEQMSAASAAASKTGSMVPQPSQPVVSPNGSWNGPIGFSTTAPVNSYPSFRPGYPSAFFPVLPGPGAGQMAQIPAFGSQGPMMQAMGLPTDPVLLAGVAMAQTGFFANPAPDVSSYPAGPLDGNQELFNVNPASVSVNPAEGFGMPALETGFTEEFYDFDLNTFGN